MALVLLLGSGVGSFGVENGLVTLMILRAETKTRDRVVYWVVNTPLYHQDPYFEVAVRSMGTEEEVVAEREPRQTGEMLPEDWKPGAVIQGRIVKHHLFLRRPNGSEVQFIITKRRKIPSQD